MRRMTLVTVEAATPRAIAVRVVLAASDAKDEIDVPIALSAFRDKNGNVSNIYRRSPLRWFFFYWLLFLEVMQ